MKETWKDIKDFEGLYQVSNLGRVRSRYKYNSRKDGAVLAEKFKNINPTKAQNGYLKATLVRDEKKINKMIHRLVAENFLNNVEGKTQVNHINGNKKDNRAENLEWVTPVENIAHAVKTGLIKVHKIKMQDMLNGEIIIFNNRKEINKYFDKKVSQDLITRCCNRKRNSAYGKKWEYVS